MTQTQTPTERKLSDAYHVIFDVKDRVPTGSLAFIQAAKALTAIKDLMDGLGYEAPKRFDVAR